MPKETVLGNKAQCHRHGPTVACQECPWPILTDEERSERRFWVRLKRQESARLAGAEVGPVEGSF